MTPYLPLATVAAIAGSAMLASAVNTGALCPAQQGLAVSTERGVLNILPLTDDIFRITVAPLEDHAERYLPSQSVILTPQKHRVNVSASPDEVVLSSPTTIVHIDRNTGLVSFTDTKGNLLIGEAAGVDNNPQVKSASFVMPRDQKFFGAGERAHSFTLNGDSLMMWNRPTYGYTGSDDRIRQMNITMPYIVSDRGYGILMDDHNRAMLTLGDTIRYTTDNPAGLLSYYFINGNGSIAGATKNYTRLTGRQQLPPFWSLGYITSKYGYRTQDETLGAIDSLKTRGYPVDGIVLDLYWYGKETDMGRLDWMPGQFPNPSQMLDSLRRQGVKTVLITQPYINKIGALDNYNRLDSLRLLTHDAQGNTEDVTTWVGEAGMFDVSNPATREWYWNRYKDLTRQGVEGWWGDLGEPEVHPESIVHDNGMTAAQYHNTYGNDWAAIIAEGFRRDFPDKRLMTLMRGGTAGLQRNNVFAWSGDVSRSWGGMEPQVKIMLNSGLSGIGYMSSDIGGFAIDPKAPTDEELYVRWLQMGVFTPTLRTHAQFKPEPYHFPSKQDITRRWIKMRYEWLPYNYTLAYENASQGLPLVRPLDFRSTSGASNADVTDEYLWGDEVLVAPVFTKGARSRRVIFPAGATWIDWFNPSLTYRGGTSATVKAPLDRMPLFVKAGSFIPQYLQPIGHTGEYDPSKLTVKYFPSADSTTYVMYDDDRTSPRSLEDEAYRIITFTGQQVKRDITIGITAGGNGYDGMPAVCDIDLQVVGLRTAPRSVTFADGSKATFNFDVRTRTLTIPVAFAGKPVKLTIH